MAVAVLANTMPPASISTSPDLRRASTSNASKKDPKSMVAATSSPNAPVPRGKRERPCDACRKRKSKCVVPEAQGTCAACTLHSQQCTYIEDPIPRKRKVESDGKNETPKKSRIVSTPSSDVSSPPSLARSDTQPMQQNNERRPSAASHASSYQSSSHNYGTYIGPTTEIEPILLDLSSEHGISSPTDMYQSRGGTAFLVDQPAMERSKAANPNSIEKVEHMVVSYGPSLVRIYKSIIHRNFPVVEEGFFMNYENGVKAHLDPALLAAIYVLAVPWLPDSSRTSPLVPDEASLEHMAFSLFGDSLINPSLSTIQAGLLLMQRPNIDSKTLNTQLVSAAYELGLQLDCTSWTTTDKGLRKRLAWALYMQDKWCSLIHGRPSLVSSNNWAVRLLEDEDFDYVPADAEEQAKAEIGQLIFKQMVSLTEILAMVLDTFYTLKAMSIVEDAEQGGTRLILERAKPVQIRLKEWFGGLPPVLKMETSSTNTPTGPAGLPIAVTSRKPSTTGTFTPHSHPSTPLTFALMTGYMHLAYFATEITLHRCIIRSLQAISITDPYLTHICRSAAKTRLISAMDFVNRLRPDHLNAFWYFPSRVSFALIGTFGSLLLATAPAQEEVDFYRTRLGEYRWTLGVSARKAHFLTFAVESLDNSSDLLKSLPRRPSTADVASAAAAAAPRSPPRESMPSPPRMQMPGYGQLPIVLEGDGSDREMEDASGLVSPSLSSGSGEGFDFNPSVSGGFARGQEQYD